jgi:hypothetical protein
VDQTILGSGLESGNDTAIMEKGIKQNDKSTDQSVSSLFDIDEDEEGGNVGGGPKDANFSGSFNKSK